MKVPQREFIISDAVRSEVPLWLCNFGASGSGKTWTGLEEATGIQQILGGDIYGLDTEGNRMLAYADYFKFKHVPMVAPYGSLDYLAAIEAIYKRGGRIIIIDSFSHEHESVGGMIDFHESEVERMSKGDWQKAEAVKMLAWTKPKQARRQLLNAMTSMKDVAFVLCFRAADASKPVKKDGKTEVVHMGFMPIGAREFVYEATVSFFLPPASKGTPSWNPENVGERIMVKLPKQFEGMFHGNEQITRNHAKHMAEWARGGAAARQDARAAATPIAGLFDRVKAYELSLRNASTPIDVEGIWRKASKLCKEADTETQDAMKLAYEGRLNEVQESA